MIKQSFETLASKRGAAYLGALQLQIELRAMADDGHGAILPSAKATYFAFCDEIRALRAAEYATITAAAGWTDAAYMAEVDTRAAD